MVQDSKVSFEYVDFYTKMSLILDAAFGNKKTKHTLTCNLLLMFQLKRNFVERHPFGHPSDIHS